MKIKECIQLAAETLNLDATLTGESDLDKLLLRCANNCLDEITSEYLPLASETEVESENGLIAYSKLGVAVYDVVWVKKEGTKVDFELFPSAIRVKKDGKYLIRFYTRPLPLAMEDEIPDLHLTPRVVSYGIAAEYMLVNGFYEEAAMYDRRFKDALMRIAWGDGSKKVKRRRWLI